ncbi:ceramide-1-phosphate transfer protein [Monodelphis domestica]|uniref:Ceramide-1-phosphate transfer protein n=1 Tax=Monodelphis domestica TaxID=13616 RepID=A0A5F8HE51_MONDO|nr:ceramide-1-phosphate transfer protein [Monodelphis domestica]XP_007481140.1 ceramide-1-phosphate transfer protein [Monodelphis domestica]XP_016285526.1 ceramide-1-phosphate transfer protein [Monodelphis domestica]XP_056652024.1 ceramide-1-phosphate transfer protein [Monodelphis domestica]
MADVDTDFNLKVVLVNFKQCLSEKEEVLMDPYLTGWKGLIKFLNNLGAVFAFISKDVLTKVQIMEKFRNSEQKENYFSLQSMVKYEISNNLVDFQKRADHPDSGCRTILRLHRALHWLQLFLDGLRTSQEDSKTSSLCTDSYNIALATYHPWLIRKAVTVAFCTLPSRNAFLETMNVGTPEEAVEMLSDAMPFIGQVYQLSQKLFEENALLDLP